MWLNKKTHHPVLQNHSYSQTGIETFSTLSRDLSQQPLKTSIPQKAHRVCLLGLREGFARCNKDDEARGKSAHTIIGNADSC